MTIRSEDRKRLWARSGNRCAVCRQELVRPDAEDSPGALVGEEAHIVARSPGGSRYEPLPVEIRDGYENLILLCANDHTEVDALPDQYQVDQLRSIKSRHEKWVQDRLRSPTADGGPTLARIMRSGNDLWPLIRTALAWYLDMPDDLTTDQEDRIDDALQTITDWCDISTDIEVQGLRSVRDAKRSMTAEIESLSQAGFILLGGRRAAEFGDDSTVVPALVLKVVRPADLTALQAEHE